MKSKPALLLFFLLIFLATASATAQQPGKEINGKVIGKAGDIKEMTKQYEQDNLGTTKY